ncbi:hypothetical protein B296_00044104 [Ensete ventricosum]|uniref:Uncharacterized protein n=1 Tax=Ensete ventricosum TaxID=4639 RepID=A0A426XJ82_ENSVE|nr:hypothetical protein B296_00044104 [Ensete ventricosum]
MTAYSAMPVKGVDYRIPARDCRLRPTLPLAEATPTVGVIAPWQSDCQRTRTTVAYAGITTTTHVMPPELDHIREI